MFKINSLKQRQSYAEVPQPNPMRWTMLLRKDDNTFEEQTGPIKCKDFFNDTLAYWKAGQVFNMYGYDNKKEKNAEGVYFLLTNIADKSSFHKGIAVLNAKMQEQLGAVVSVQDHKDDSVIILTPNEVWNSTWCLSLVTMLIRCCNYGYKYEKWDDFYHSQAPMNSVEHAFDERAKKNTQKWGFIVPKSHHKYWFFVGKDYNSEATPKLTGGYIHNNGCVNWSSFMNLEGVSA